ncbi:complement factor I-like [Centruroides sculpturatus]|uniref:complement factor I-like n=1 Tax=Centruroides sculpturatus TaxID=218467 RepID=UPI000C6CB530|nr:complement factor I-like [Centruroides sculpturatus]
MKNFLRIGLMLFLSAEYYFCASEKYENTTSRVIERRMIGGREAEKGEFPFLVAIFKKNRFKGAFSLITTRTLIGTAHVVAKYKVKDIYGRIGDVNKNAGKKVLFRRRIIHGRYNPKEYNNNDIALLILAHRINDISPIALVRKDLTFTEGHATLVGWGNIGFKKDDKTDLLQVAEVNLVDPKYVARKFDYELTYKEITTVSSRVIGMKGDSGSPLIKRDALNRPVLIGILSNGGNNTGKPDVYMSTSVHYSFIRTFRVGRPTYLDVKN